MSNGAAETSTSEVHVETGYGARSNKTHAYLVRREKVGFVNK